MGKDSPKYLVLPSKALATRRIFPCCPYRTFIIAQPARGHRLQRPWGNDPWRACLHVSNRCETVSSGTSHAQEQ